MEKNPYNEFLSIIKETSKSNITENKLYDTSEEDLLNMLNSPNNILEI